MWIFNEANCVSVEANWLRLWIVRKRTFSLVRFDFMFEANSWRRSGPPRCWDGSLSTFVVQSSLHPCSQTQIGESAPAPPWCPPTLFLVVTKEHEEALTKSKNCFNSTTPPHKTKSAFSNDSRREKNCFIKNKNCFTKRKNGFKIWRIWPIFWWLADWPILAPTPTSGDGDGDGEGDQGSRRGRHVHTYTGWVLYTVWPRRLANLSIGWLGWSLHGPTRTVLRLVHPCVDLAVCLL